MEITNDLLNSIIEASASELRQSLGKGAVLGDAAGMAPHAADIHRWVAETPHGREITVLATLLGPQTAIPMLLALGFTLGKGVAQAAALEDISK